MRGRLDHLLGEVHPDHGGAAAGECGGARAGPGADVEDPLARLGVDRADRRHAPEDRVATREDGIREVVSLRDAVEHLADLVRLPLSMSARATLQLYRGWMAGR